MVLCGTKNGSYGIAVKNLLSTFIFKSVDDHEANKHGFFLIHGVFKVEHFMFESVYTV